MIKTIEWKDNAVLMLNQRRLPIEVTYIECRDYRTVAEGIRKLWVRGAPAIGIAAAMGIALAARDISAGSMEEFKEKLEPAFQAMLATRPTAVNIQWAVSRLKKLSKSSELTVFLSGGKSSELSLKRSSMKIWRSTGR